MQSASGTPLPRTSGPILRSSPALSADPGRPAGPDRRRRGLVPRLAAYRPARPGRDHRLRGHASGAEGPRLQDHLGQDPRPTDHASDDAGALRLQGRRAPGRPGRDLRPTARASDDGAAPRLQDRRRQARRARGRRRRGRASAASGRPTDLGVPSRGAPSAGPGRRRRAPAARRAPGRPGRARRRPRPNRAACIPPPSRPPTSPAGAAGIARASCHAFLPALPGERSRGSTPSNERATGKRAGLPRVFSGERRRLRCAPYRALTASRQERQSREQRLPPQAMQCVVKCLTWPGGLAYSEGASDNSGRGPGNSGGGRGR
jgi:hypothetical protein